MRLSSIVDVVVVIRSFHINLLPIFLTCIDSNVFIQKEKKLSTLQFWLVQMNQIFYIYIYILIM